MKPQFTRRLNWREATGAVIVLAILSGLGYCAYPFAAEKMLEARVNAAVPKVCASIRRQRQSLINAIEAYKAHFGVYPPDHVLNRQPLVVDAVTNSLVYELAGVMFNSTNHQFRLGGMDAADANFVKHFFQCDGFKNSGERAEQITHFLPSPPSLEVPLRELNDDPEIYVLASPMSVYSPDDEIAPEVRWEIDISPWRYICTSPTNNPGKFDLWIEVKTKSRTVTLGNWQAVD
jgi:hypothetical protein